MRTPTPVTSRITRILGLVGLVGPLGCADGENATRGDTGASATTSASGGTDTVDPTSGQTSGDPSATDGTSTDSGSASGSSGATATTGATSGATSGGGTTGVTTGATTGGTAGTTGVSGGTTGSTGAVSSGSTGGGTSGTSGTTGGVTTNGSTGGVITTGGSTGGACGGGGGVVTDSFIWIANSSEGTVSKIDTRDLVEEGRYLARPDGAGSPSRTSVSLEGDVAVLSRLGGVAKFFADEADCLDTNGTPGIQTSAGGGQWLAWDEEECRAWYTSMNYTNMRAVAWTSGTLNEQTCVQEDQKVWVAGNTAAAGSTVVHRLNGDDGTIEDTVALPTLELPLGHGAYGAAVDGNNDLWIVQIYQNELVRVAYDDLAVDKWDEPNHAYGITMGPNGRVFLCNRHIDRFDPIAQTWTSQLVEDWQGFYGHSGGCMIDADGILWKGIDEMLYAVDSDTLQVVDMIVMPEGMQWGVAVDYDGFIWTVPKGGTTAYRVDPMTHEIETVGGLVGAYTYSDMTGFLLQSVVPQ
jgi:streptogramin lyase